LEYDDGKTGFSKRIMADCEYFGTYTDPPEIFDKYCHFKMFLHRSQLADCVHCPAQEQLITIQSYNHKDNEYSLHRNEVLI